MKKHPMMFKICLILLLFGIASVQSLKDNGSCENEDAETDTCHKNIKENAEIETDEPDTHKSVFAESHDCKLGSDSDDDASNSNEADGGSCLRKAAAAEDEDQSDLSMLGEQITKEEDAEPCKLCEKKTCKCSETAQGDRNIDEPESGSVGEGGSDLKSQESSDAMGISNRDQSADALLENPEEGDRNDQDPDVENVPLREILLKLKPEGLTDNEEDQPSEFSVTEASMGEDEEVEEEILVSSGSAEKQESGLDSSNGESGKNGSGSSSSGMNKKAICSDVNTTEIIADVEIINATLLMKLLQGNPNVTNRSSAAPCHLIYFFSPYCHFSVAGSPYVNAMARSLRNIPVYGLDSIEHHSVNARYGVMGTPTLLLFHNGNGVGRYNASEFSVMQLLAFVNHYTDQTITDINVTSADFRATLPAQIAEGRPYALWASWIFLLSCAAWLFLTSELCARLTEAILNNWREAEAQNDQD